MSWYTTMRWLGIARRVPDTTLRDLLCKLTPVQLRRHLHAALLPKQSRAAVRRKALTECALPFGVAALDTRPRPCRAATISMRSGRRRAKGRSSVSRAP